MDSKNRTCEQILSANDDFAAWNINAKEASSYIPSGVFLTVLICLGITGNCLVIYVYAFHFKHSTVNMFIKVLAIIDVVCCTIGMPVEIVDCFFPLLNGEPYSCKIFRTIEQTAEFVSGEVLLLIAYDRYLHVCKPFRVFSVEKAKRLVYITVVIGIAVSIPTALVIGKTETVIRGIKLYGCNRVTDNLTTFIYYICINSILGLSFVSMILIYVCIWSSIHTWKNTNIGETVFVTSVSKQGPFKGNTVERNCSKTNSVNLIGREDTSFNAVARLSGQLCDRETSGRRLLALRRRTIVKPVIILFAVAFVFIISYVPYCILTTLEVTQYVHVEQLPIRHRQIWELAYKSYFLSNVLNPIVYGIYDHRFRRKCFDILFRRKHK